MAILAAWIHFDEPALLAITLPIAAVVGLSGAARRVATGRWGAGLLSIGLLLLALAASTPAWESATTATVAVMVDLSASTRGATYRQRDVLERRIAAMLGNTPRHLFSFADGISPLPGDAVLPDVPSDQTRFTPPAADAVLLFSDGRFEPPAKSPPVFAVIDSALERPVDAAVEQLETVAGRPVATVRVSGPARTLKLGKELHVVAHEQRIAAATTQPGMSFSAQLSTGDLWPENDAMIAFAPPPTILQRWWVGGRDPGPGWTRLDPAALPSDPLSLLGVAVMVLDDVSADAISPAQAEALRRYVDDEGGGLLIIGGARAFEPVTQASVLLAITPLTPMPPTPTRQWVVLGDGSGSMAGQRCLAQAAAIRQMLPVLPPHDLVRVGSFAKTVSWWSEERPAAEFAGVPLPPADLFPHGPTELENALRQALGDDTGDQPPMQLLLITDADATLDAPDSLLAAMRSRHVTLNVLAVGDGAALPTLMQLSSETGGHVARAVQPSLWAATGKKWVSGLVGPATRQGDMRVAFANAAAALGGRRIHTWERTWLRAGATLLASGDSGLPLGARWSVGSGNVAAVAFAASPADAEQLAVMVSARPRDPRFAIQCRPGRKLDIQVDAAEPHGFLNQLRVDVQLAESGGATATVIVPQTAPGRYEAQWPAPRRPVLCSVRIDGTVIQRIAVPGRYAPEFENVGNDRGSLKQMAERSGGAVIESSDDQPIQFHWPVRRRSLTMPLALVAAGLLLAGLVRRG